jgi:hypothetical protein
MVELLDGLGWHKRGLEACELLMKFWIVSMEEESKPLMWIKAKISLWWTISRRWWNSWYIPSAISPTSSTTREDRSISMLWFIWPLQLSLPPLLRCGYHAVIVRTWTHWVELFSRFGARTRSSNIFRLEKNSCRRLYIQTLKSSMSFSCNHGTELLQCRRRRRIEYSFTMRRPKVMLVFGSFTKTARYLTVSLVTPECALFLCMKIHIFGECNCLYRINPFGVYYQRWRCTEGCCTSQSKPWRVSVCLKRFKWKTEVEWRSSFCTHIFHSPHDLGEVR